MSFSLYKNLDPVLTCNKCRKPVTNFSKTYVVWNTLDELDEDSSLLDTLLMHEKCLTEMMYEFADTDMEPGDLKTISILDYMIKLIMQNPLKMSIVI